MKVKCPFYPASIKCKEPCPIFVDGKCDMEIKISTADLITELEKRWADIDCNKCIQSSRYLNEVGRCENCIGRGIKIRDNFKAK